MAKYVFILITLFTLSACATAQPVDVDKRLAVWIGQDADTLVKAWGAPDRSYEFKNGRRTLEYERNRIDANSSRWNRPQGSMVVGSDGTSIGIGAPLLMDGPGFHVRRCLIKFETNPNHIIKSTYHEGDNCAFALSK